MKGQLKELYLSKGICLLNGTIEYLCTYVCTSTYFSVLFVPETRGKSLDEMKHRAVSSGSLRAGEEGGGSERSLPTTDSASLSSASTTDVPNVV